MRTLLLAASLLLLAPGAAGAAVTPGDYGGGGVTASGRATSMWAQVAPASARVGGTTQVACALGRFDAQVTLAPDGTFSFTRIRTARQLGHVIRARITVKGRFDGTVATGTVRARVRDRTPRGTLQRCGTREPRAWKLHLRPAAGAPAAPQPGGVYLGLTSQPGAVPQAFLLRVNRAGARVGVALFQYVHTCGEGTFPLNNVTPGGPIAAGGAFALRERFTLRAKGGIRERFSVRVDGQFAAGGVGGSLQVTSEVRRDGRVIDRCDTGAVGFGALL